MTLRARADGLRTEPPTSKRDNSILVGSILVCFAGAGCLRSPLHFAPDAGAGGGTGSGRASAGSFSDANPSEIWDAGGIDEGGTGKAAGCAAPNPNGCSYPDEFATCPGNPAECVNGEWQCPFGVPCKTYGSDSDAPNGGDADTAPHAADASDSADASGHCIGEGKESLYPMGADCCPGLRSIVAGMGPMAPLGSGESQPNCLAGLDQWVCSRCGNGVCEDWERPCGCPQDCGPVCGDKKCPVGSYCIEHHLLAGPDAGTPSYECIDVATDCDGGAFGNCASASQSACDYTERWIVLCRN